MGPASLCARTEEEEGRDAHVLRHPHVHVPLLLRLCDRRVTAAKRDQGEQP